MPEWNDVAIIVPGIGALAYAVKVLANRRNGNGSHSSPCTSLKNLWDEHVKLRDINTDTRSELSAIRATQTSQQEAISEIKANTGRLVDRLLDKQTTDPGPGAN